MKFTRALWAGLTLNLSLAQAATAPVCGDEFVERLFKKGPPTMEQAPDLALQERERAIPLLENRLAASPAQMTAQTWVKAATVTLVSDNVASRRTRGDWGYAALLKLEVPIRDSETADTRYILFDTGSKPDALIENLATLGTLSPPDADMVGFDDLRKLTGGKKIDIVLSHWHDDHTTGLASFLKKYCPAGGEAADCLVSRIVVGDGFFTSRWKYDPKTGVEETKDNNGPFIKAFLQDESPLKSFLPLFRRAKEFGALYADSDAVWVSGFIKRYSGEDSNTTNYFKLPLRDGTKIHDPVPDEIALSFGTPRGAVVVTGCAHAGIINTLYNIYLNTGGLKKLDAILGGMHLFDITEGYLAATAVGFDKFEFNSIVGGHCTGDASMDALRDLFPKGKVVQNSSVQLKYKLVPVGDPATASIINPKPATYLRLRKGD